MARDRRPVLSSIGDPDAAEWLGLMESCHPDASRPLRSLVELWRRSRGRDALVLRGSVTLRDCYRDLVFAAALRHLRRRKPRVLMTDATWEPRSRSITARAPWLAPVIPAVARTLIRLLDGPHVRYAVLSEGERESFAETWGIPVDRVVFTPFPMTLYDHWDEPTHDGGYLFAGGNSLRDYELLAEAVRDVDVDVHVASRWVPAHPTERLHARTTSHDEFVELLLGCRAMVLPLERSVRSAGQQTYLNAMVLGKPVVVTDGLGVRDYIVDGVTGVVVPPDDPQALRAALVHLLDPANAEHYAEMGRRARADVLTRFMPEHYVATLVRELGYTLPAGGPR